MDHTVSRLTSSNWTIWDDCGDSLRRDAVAFCTLNASCVRIPWSHQLLLYLAPSIALLMAYGVVVFEAWRAQGPVMRT